MLVDKFFKRGLSGQAFLSAGAPILALVLLAIAGAFAVFINFAQQQDRSYVENTHRLVANTLDGRLHALSDVTLDYANWNDAYNAISVHWNNSFVSSNFYSTVTDAMVIFHDDGAIRYVWKADAMTASADMLASQIVSAARNVPSLHALPRAPTAAGTVSRSFAILNGRLALLSVAAVTRESDAERLQRAPGAPVDYLASVDILDPAQIAAIGAELDLAGFTVTPHEIVDRDLVSLPLRASNGALLGYAQWHNAHPGSAAFNRQIGPVVFGVALVGALSVLMALVLMRRQVAAATQIEGALEASRLKSEFISNMSHELRTPLDAILGYAELIQEEAPKGNLFDGVRQDAASITDSAKRLRQLIDDVLDHSRIDAGRLQLAPEPINVPELFAEIEDALEPRVRAQGTKLSFACEHARLSLIGDHQRLRQCLLNLAENSLQFTSQGEVTIAAGSARVNETDCIVFEVKDNGLGVTRAAAATLFEPFTQASNGSARSKRGGTLALSISRKLARAMGGDITFDGAPSGGAHFTLTVPSKLPVMFANAA